ncbi:hypothetical protein MNBD_GAMMA26-2098 [hydrothermal vent metagenome]|uniref:Regulatory protein RecX n=1 Tax=hydrothermal vent metagenome TaxID=652676 RepID=A0A3B1ATZ7_9ZZZZ
MRLLAAREHSQAELRRKLCARSYDGAAVDEVLDQLIQRHLQSDDRFTEQYISSRQGRGFGPVRIRAELRERGIDGGLIGDHLDGQDEQWVEYLRQAHDKKFGAVLPTDLTEKARRVRFLEYRGFTGSQIRGFFLQLEPCNL